MSSPAPPVSQSEPVATTPAVWLIYDGDCPFCAAAAQMVRIKQAAGALHILNARDAAGHPLITEIAAADMDLNAGIVVKLEDHLYHGAEALNLLALIGSDTGWLNRLNIALFRNRATVDMAYPLLRAVRNLMLRVRGKQPI